MPNILIIGATRGLGASLANAYAAERDTTVFGTTRAAAGPKGLDEKIVWIPNIDVAVEGVGKKLVNQLGMLGGGGGMVEGGKRVFDVVIITAGYFATEDWTNGPKWEEEVKMYTTSAISPPFIVHSLFKSKHISKGSKILLVSSESGSIFLRHSKEGGGNYAHHASKTALNMVGKLLSLDLKDEGVIISIVHPGFMRTEMTKGVGFDKYWDDGGAVTPDEAAKSLIEWTEKLDISKSGQYWAPRGPRDIGTADVTMGDPKTLPTPLQLPW
ncbi:probable oxidoreductase, short chain dehydrogenase/reductase family superfamily [Phialocephala subalpina]|uniref:Probable oxidoreductase, short chain dehydrogenase/reductase family superfamily n=1 Tax=Phialocephala subalpina TaxID=576137 RepID=A0A1L7XFN3_9HELO|nr:probable oxidoreductase, short chain dehydrogenase/reductase family superfamily [Phialocephala subalpina]